MKVVEKTTEFSLDTVNIGDVIRVGKGNTHDYWLLATDGMVDYVLINLSSGEIVDKSGTLSVLLASLTGLDPVVVNAEISINR